MKRPLALAVALAFLGLVTSAGADEPRDPASPPWLDADDLPVPEWVRSVAPRRGDLVIFESPTRHAQRRGVSLAGARLGFYGTTRAWGCVGRWLLVGPLAWVCGDSADLSSDEPYAPVPTVLADSLPFSYFFVGRDGASAYRSPGDEAPERDLEAGWAISVVEQRSVQGERWGKTSHGQWVPMHDLFPARPSTFHGERVDFALDFAWVVSERANVFAAAGAGRSTGSKVRFERVGWHAEKTVAGACLMVRTSAEKDPPEWMLARDLLHPTLAVRPAEVVGDNERWIDVDRGSQTLVAYEGSKPVYATLVSTGRGTGESMTPAGVSRIWVKLFTSTMDNVERDLDKHYSMEDVPYVQFFNKAVAIHGAFWHREFGRVKSHGCVNLAPQDAKVLFDFTSPHLPEGWAAVFPTRLEPGTVIRVR